MSERDGFARSRKLGDHLKRHRLQKHALNLMLKASLLAIGKGRYLTNHPLGLSEGAIIGGHLAFPDIDEEADNTSSKLVYDQAHAGEWLAYEFAEPRPPNEREAGPLFEGKLFAVMLDEVMDNPADRKTPPTMLRLVDLDHFLKLAAPSFEELVDCGFVEPTTYRQAYEQAGTYEQYAGELDGRGLTDQLVHTVTPKGNTLIFLLPASGSPRPKSQTEYGADLSLAHGGLHVA